MKVGIPKSMFYYLDGEIIINFFTYLNVEIIVSSNTTKKTIQNGIKYAPDEMCLSMKNYIGHVYDLKDICDYIIIPRIDNYYTFNQTCTNFLAVRDIVCNMFDIKVLDYNIDLNNKSNLKKGLVKIALTLGYKINKINQAYKSAITKYNIKRRKEIINNLNRLNSNKKKVLIISHNYNVYDELIGKPVIDLLKKENIEIIYSDQLDRNICRKLSKNLSSDLYWKYSKEAIGAYEMVKNKVNGVVFLSTFPCGLDSLVNEFLAFKVEVPYLNIVIDDLDADNGLETRIESFSDILCCNK